MVRRTNGESCEQRETSDLGPASRPRETVRGPTCGQLHGITPEGFVLVTWYGGAPQRASFATPLSDRALLRAIELQAAVLIDFLDGDPELPVVTGILRDRLDVDAIDPSTVIEQRIELTAGETLTLRCGESAIELQKDGRVVVRGTEVRSVATGGNTIQGAHVDIN